MGLRVSTSLCPKPSRCQAMFRAAQQVSLRGSSRALAAHRSAANKAGTWMDGPMNFETNLVHAAVSPEEKSGAVLTPLVLSTTFVQESVEKYLAKGYSYSRTNNPTVTALEQKTSHLGGWGWSVRVRHWHGCHNVCDQRDHEGRRPLCDHRLLVRWNQPVLPGVLYATRYGVHIHRLPRPRECEEGHEAQHQV